MYRAGLESILGFKLRGSRLQIDPCVPRWWRDFEITYRRGLATYRIKVENPLGLSRGVGTVYVPYRFNCPADVSVLTLRRRA